MSSLQQLPVQTINFPRPSQFCNQSTTMSIDESLRVNRFLKHIVTARGTDSNHSPRTSADNRIYSTLQVFSVQQMAGWSVRGTTVGVPVTTRLNVSCRVINPTRKADMKVFMLRKFYMSSLFFAYINISPKLVHVTAT